MLALYVGRANSALWNLWFAAPNSFEREMRDEIAGSSLYFGWRGLSVRIVDVALPVPGTGGAPPMTYDSRDTIVVELSWNSTTHSYSPLGRLSKDLAPHVVWGQCVAAYYYGVATDPTGATHDIPLFWFGCPLRMQVGYRAAIDARYPSMRAAQPNAFVDEIYCWSGVAPMVPDIALQNYGLSKSWNP